MLESVMERFFDPQHIEAHRGDAPAPIAEQAVHSLALVSALVRSGLAFRFKGGNSLLVILQKPRRFSIDVDISTGESRETIETALETAVEASPVFTRWERRAHQTKPWLPLASFKVFFRPRVVDAPESFIFLDAQLKKSEYPGARVPVRCLDLYDAGETVEVPTVGGILGDKLLTLGPSTYGIPLGKNKEAQRLKHVFDVATLARKTPSLAEIRLSVQLCMEQEARLQERTYALEEVVQDTLKFCACASPHPAPPNDPGDEPYLDEIVRGFPAFREHLFSRDYTWTDLQTDLARAALSLVAAADREVTDEAFRKRIGGEGPADGLQGPLASVAEHNPTAASLWASVLRLRGEPDLLA